MEDADRVRAAADAGDDRVRQQAGEVLDLLAGLHPDDPLEVADHHRERVRAADRADAVVRGLDRGHPVAEGLVHRVLERPGARGDRDDLGAEHPHAGHVQRLPPGVLLAHVDRALEAEQGAGGRGRHAVLAGPGLRDHPGLAHPLGQQHLAEHVVDLVAAGVREILALEQHPRAAAELRPEPLRLADQGRPGGVVREQVGQLGGELRVGPRRLVLLGQLLDGRHQRLGREQAAVDAEVPGRIGNWGNIRFCGCGTHPHTLSRPPRGARQPTGRARRAGPGAIPPSPGRPPPPAGPSR